MDGVDYDDAMIGTAVVSLREVDPGAFTTQTQGFDDGAQAANTRRTYLAAHAHTLSVDTLTLRPSAVAMAHCMAGHPMKIQHLIIHDVMCGLRRENGLAQSHLTSGRHRNLDRRGRYCGERGVPRDQQSQALGGAVIDERDERYRAATRHLCGAGGVDDHTSDLTPHVALSATALC